MNPSNIAQFMVYGVLGFTLLLTVIVFLMISHKKRQYLYHSEKKEREYQYKNELLNTQLELQEHLLNQVSCEIHDNVGQVLSLVKVHLFSVSNQLENDKAIRLLDTSSELLNKAIEDLRNISHAQSASIVQRLGLKETISKELGYIKSLRKTVCELEVKGNSYSLLPEQELFIYRIVQEAINNSMKHANAGKLKVTLNYEPTLFTLTVADNGTGFDTSKEPARPGIGIAHMKQRAKLLLADLQIDSKLSHGTSVTLKMPQTNV